MNLLKEYGLPIFYVAVGIFLFIITRNPETFGPEKTEKIAGILSKTPEEGVHGESEEYIGLWIQGNDNFYEFSNCSYNKKIAEKVKLLKSGDSITLFVEKNNSSSPTTWAGKEYYTFNICDASSPKYGHFISFEQYNRCNDNKSNMVYPILSGIIILMGLFDFYRKYKDNESINESKYISSWKIMDESKVPINLKPDKLTYILRNSSFSIFSIGFGLFLNYPFNQSDLNTFGILSIIIGLYMIFHYTMIHDKVYYVIDSSAIHIRKISVLFQTEISVIKYSSIERVIFRQAFFEISKNIGTVLIDSGEKNSDGEKIYSEMIGINDYKEIAKLVLERANIND